MIAYLSGSGFLDTKAQVGADLSLVLMAIATVMLTAGVVLARRRNYEAHRWVQTSAVCLNALVVAVWMIRSLVLYVIPKVPARLGELKYAVNVAHAVIGIAAVALGVFIVLRTANLVPKAWRFRNYKAWMRVGYGLYLAGMLAGVVLYVVAYGGK